MHAIRSRLALLAAVLATLLASVPAAADSFDSAPVGAPAPTLDGPPFSLGSALAPSISALVREPAGETVLLSRIVADPSPHVVVQRIDLFTGVAVGDPIVVSDDASTPVDGDASALATTAIQLVDSSVAAQEGSAPEGPSQEWVVVWAAHAGTGVRLVGQRLDIDGSPVGQPLTLTREAYDAIGDVELVWQAPHPQVLVVWSGTRPGDDGRAQVHARTWDVRQSRLAPDDTTLSSPAGDALGSLGVNFNFEAVPPDTSVSDVDTGIATRVVRTLVIWRGTDPAAIGDADEQEVLGRVLDEHGAPVGDVVRLSHVGADGDAAARPLDAALNNDLLFQDAPYAWLVAWSQSPTGDAAVRRLDVHAEGPAATIVTPADPAEQIGHPVPIGFEGGDDGLVYDVGAADGSRRVVLQQLHADGSVVGDPLPLSPPDVDARAPLAIETNYICRQLVVWRAAADTGGRFVWEPGCPEGVLLSAHGTPLLGSLRLSSRRFHVRTHGHGGAMLRARLRERATVTLAIRRCRGDRPRRCAHSRLVAISRRLHRPAGKLALHVSGRTRRGAALPPGRYRLTLRAVHGKRIAVRRAGFTLLR